MPLPLLKQVQCVDCGHLFNETFFNTSLAKCGHRFCSGCVRRRRLTAQTGCSICYPELSFFDRMAAQHAASLTKMLADSKEAGMKTVRAPSKGHERVMQSLKEEARMAKSPFTLSTSAIPDAAFSFPEPTPAEPAAAAAASGGGSTSASSGTASLPPSSAMRPCPSNGATEPASSSSAKGSALTSATKGAAPTSAMKGPAPAASSAVKGPAPAASSAVKGPAPAASGAVKGPAPAASSAVKGPAPAASSAVKGPAPATSSAVKGPAPTPTNAVKGPAPTPTNAVRGPAPAASSAVKGTAPTSVVKGPAPTPTSAVKGSALVMKGPASTSATKGPIHTSAAKVPTKRHSPPSAVKAPAPVRASQVLAPSNTSKGPVPSNSAKTTSSAFKVPAPASSGKVPQATSAAKGPQPAKAAKEASKEASSVANTTQQPVDGRRDMEAKAPSKAVSCARKNLFNVSARETPRKGRSKGHAGTPSSKAHNAPKKPAAPPRNTNCRPSALVEAHYKSGAAAQAKKGKTTAPAPSTAVQAAAEPQGPAAGGLLDLDPSPRRIGGAPAGPRYSDSWGLDSSTASSTASTSLDDTMTLKVQGRSEVEVDHFIRTGYWPRACHVGGLGATPRPPAEDKVDVHKLIQQKQMMALERRLNMLDSEADRIRACWEFKTQRTVAGRVVTEEPRWVTELLRNL